MSKRKTKVLSVRLDLATLQSCFDLCEALGHPTRGASGAISRTLFALLKDLRDKEKLPSYTQSELELLTAQFMAIANNPTTAMSLEKLGNLDTFDITNEDFAPESAKPYTTHAPVCALPSISNEEEFAYTEQEEYNFLLEEKIREQMKEDEDLLLAKILIGGL